MSVWAIPLFENWNAVLGLIDDRQRAQKVAKIINPYLQVWFPLPELGVGDVVRTWRVLCMCMYWLRMISVWRMSLQPHVLCVCLFLVCRAIIWGWLPQPTGSSDRRLQRTRTQCPAVLTRPLADPRSHDADLTTRRHGEWLPPVE